MRRLTSLLTAAMLATACSSAPAGSVQRSPSPVAGGLVQGLIAYAGGAGIGVLDPATGKSTIVAPVPPGGFRLAGPVWAPAPNVDHPVIYFTIHDDRTPERRNTAAGIVPYNWIFRVDPFAGTIEPVAASQDSVSEGPLGLVANSRYLALTTGCCATYEVDALDLTRPAAEMKVLSRPPEQTAFFTQGVAPGESPLVAVRAFGTGAWYWLNADAAVLHPFPLKLGPDDGPIAISPDGTMAAVALSIQGAVIQPINSRLPLTSPSASESASTSASASPSLRATPAVSPAAPRKINSKLLHPDGLAWSPEAKQLALAVNGEVEIYLADAPDGPPAVKYLAGAGVVGVAWSGLFATRMLDEVKPSPGPQATVDALLTATRLPAAADTPANRPLTQVYLWQFDSAKTSPIESIADATPAIVDTYPPLGAGVVYHHWAPSANWTFLGGCYRYRVVITGSIPPIAATVGLQTSTPCSVKPTPTQSPKPSPS